MYFNNFSLSDDIMRVISICRELDVKTNSEFFMFTLHFSLLIQFPSLLDIVREAETITEKLSTSTREKKAKLSTRLQQIFIKLQDLNDEKIHFGQILSEKIEKKSRAVERDLQNNLNSKPTDRTHSPIPSSSTARKSSIEQQLLSSLPLKRTSATASIASTSSSSENNNDRGGNHKRIRRTRTDVTEEVVIKTENFGTKSMSLAGVPSSSAIAAKKNIVAAANKKAKKATAKKAVAVATKQNTAAVQEPVQGIQDDVDPDEETYCLCGQISYGEMILCENDLCGIEWFHFSCVSLQSKPKGKW